MWKAILITILTTLLANCTQKAGDIVDEKVKRFHTDVLLRTTPVKDQGNSNACWIYAMLATIESEHLRDGDSVNLSATYLCRHALAEQVQPPPAHTLSA